MAHLNLVMIHPFSDGNGRMARCLQTLVLAREGILEPEFSSIEEYLGRNTQDYYSVLAETSEGSWHPKKLHTGVDSIQSHCPFLAGDYASDEDKGNRPVMAGLKAHNCTPRIA